MTAIRERVDGLVRADRVHRADRIDEHATVVVPVRIEDALRHEPGMRGRRADRVCGVASRPAAALPTRVHDEMRVPGCRPQDRLVSEAAPTAVALELNDRRESLAAGGGQV